MDALLEVKNAVFFGFVGILMLAAVVMSIKNTRAQKVHSGDDNKEDDQPVANGPNYKSMQQ